MLPMLSAGRVSTVAIEVSQRWLKPQSCSAEELLVLLLRAGFNVNLKSTPSCAFEGGFGCDLVVDRADAMTTQPCRWVPFKGAHRCI